MALTPKQQAFVDEYLIDLNATAAAKRAGYSEKTAEQIGHENLRKPEIDAAITKAMQERSERTKITADDVLKELVKIGFGNIKNLYGDGNTLRHITELPDEVTATIQEVTEETIGGQDSPIVRRKYKVADKKSSLELIGKHLKMFTDKLEVEMNDSLAERLRKARERTGSGTTTTK